MTKIELLADLASKVVAVGDNKLIGQADAMANVRRYDVDVYTTLDADGNEEMTTQRIHVHSESTPEERAVYTYPLRKNFVDNSALKGNDKVFAELVREQTDGEIKGFSLSHTINLADDLKAGIFVITNLDDTETMMAYSILGDDVKKVPYKNVNK
jgi:hypothetical protein